MSESFYSRFFENEMPQDQSLLVCTLTVNAQTCYLRFFNESVPIDQQAEALQKSAVTPQQLHEAQVEKPVQNELIKEASQTSTSQSSILSRFKSGMKKTRSSFTQGLTSLFSSHTSFDREFYDELETQLIMADVGVATTSDIIEKLKAYAQEHKLKGQNNEQELLRQHLKQLLIKTLVPVEEKPAPKETQMIIIVGVNGVGKTTTIGKLAYQAKAKGQKVMLAAGDTFRAAAVEQLQVWGERTGVPVVAQTQGADSASVIFDALQSAQSKGMDLLIADTAGRLHNKSNLMQELQKIVRVVKKINPNAPHKVLLVLDGCTGQNALSQGKEFNDAVELTGLVVTKLDGTAKGGIVFALSKTLGVPVEYVGIGEGMEDLRAFDPTAYVEALIDFES